MSNSSSKLDGFDPFAGIGQTDPIQRTSSGISDDVASIRKKATDPIDITSKDNMMGVGTVTPENGALDNVLNDFTSDTLGRMSDAYQSKTEEFSVDDIRDVITIEDGSIGPNKEYLMDELSDVLGFTLGDSEAFKGELGDKLFEEFTKFTSPDGGALLDFNGGELSFKDGWRDGTTEGLIYSLAMAGIEIYKEVKDSAAQDAFDATSLYGAVQAGMVEAYRPIYNKIKPNSKAVGMVIISIQYAVNNGDYVSLKELLSILGEEQFPKVKAYYPTLCRDFLKSFYIDPKVYLHQHDELCQDMRAVFASIYGDEWYKVQTWYGMAFDVTMTSECSDDAVTILSTDLELGILVALRGTFTEDSAAEVFFTQFQNTPRIEDSPY